MSKSRVRFWLGGEVGEDSSHGVSRDWSGGGAACRWELMGATPDFIDLSFGSAHWDGFHTLICDGSVRQISYTIDIHVHEQLGKRKDGTVITRLPW